MKINEQVLEKCEQIQMMGNDNFIHEEIENIKFAKCVLESRNLCFPLRC